MNDLTYQRCMNHGQREAVARCPECSHFFCRECIAEHEGRVVCANCLAGLVKASGGRRTARYRLAHLLPFIAALLFIWICFLSLGQALLSLPDAFHSGEVWQSTDWEDE